MRLLTQKNINSALGTTLVVLFVYFFEILTSGRACDLHADNAVLSLIQACSVLETAFQQLRTHEASTLEKDSVIDCYKC